MKDDNVITIESLMDAIQKARDAVPFSMEDSYYDGWANALTELEFILDIDWLGLDDEERQQ